MDSPGSGVGTVGVYSYPCEDCQRSSSGNCGKHTIVFLQNVASPSPPTGWRCPGCGTYWAPFVSYCTFLHQQ